jgi:hypothetical protein
LFLSFNEFAIENVQAMYFGQSFGRIGADFRLCLVPILTAAMRDVTMAHLDGAEERFRTGMYHLALKANVSKGRDEQVGYSCFNLHVCNEFI